MFAGALEERCEKALHSPDPGRALRALVQDLSREGLQKEEIYELLEKFLTHLRRKEGRRQSDEDLVLDVMDALTGWCHPEAQLLPNDKPR